MLPKLPFCLNVETTSKSSNYEDYDVVLTFGRFSDAFLSKPAKSGNFRRFNIDFLQSRYRWSS